MSFGVVLFVQVEILWQIPGLPIRGDACFVPGNPPRPHPITGLSNISEIIYEMLQPDTERRQISLRFNFTWTAPLVPYGNFLRYNIWLGSEILSDPNDGSRFIRLEVGVLCI